MEFEWRPQGQGPSEWGMTCGSAIKNLIDRLISENVPELSVDAPTAGSDLCETHFGEDWFAIRITFNHHRGVAAIDLMKRPVVEAAEAILVSGAANADFYQIASEWNNEKVFTYIGPRNSGALCWSHVAQAVATWLENIVLPDMLATNRKRVLRAIPAAPVYDLEALYAALWVLESDEQSEQGTAFALENVGLVTCHHCLRADTKALRWSDTSKKYPVTVVKSQARVDLAVLEGPTIEHALPIGSPSSIKQMDHLLVLGHPNHRVGDTPICSPGLVVGFRPFSSVRRILTNAAIVAGASGGPVVDASGKVIGVAVCGSRTFRSAAETEDHAVIPIDALELI